VAVDALPVMSSPQWEHQTATSFVSPEPNGEILAWSSGRRASDDACDSASDGGDASQGERVGGVVVDRPLAYVQVAVVDDASELGGVISFLGVTLEEARQRQASHGPSRRR
jgi:hypothetical protein